jgi:carboxyl-terminal processing protease
MHRRGLTWLAIITVIGLMFLRLPQMAAKQDAVLNTYSALVEVDALARQRFVESVDGSRLVDGAIRGLLLQLDPYSGYISPEELPAFERRSAGDYIGVGIEIGAVGDEMTVITPIDGSPAARAGVRPGDVIVSVDGQDIKGLSVFDLERLLIGRPGTSVRLRLQHSGEDDPETVTITRGPVNLTTVRGCWRGSSGKWEFMLDPEHRIGYVRVSRFIETTIRDFDSALAGLLLQGARGLIIDLRFNPGGRMQQAVGMVNRFVDSGVIVSTVTRRKAVREYRATKGGTNAGVDLAVLINGGSASASEIVAGALQARGRALVVGERSFGKGSVQQLIYLIEKKGAVKLTTAYYRMPDGRIIHRNADHTESDPWGVIPDVEIALSDEEVRAIQDSRHALDQAFTESPPASSTDESATPGHPAPRPNHQQDPLRQVEIHHDRQLLEALLRLRHRTATTQSAEAREPTRD